MERFRYSLDFGSGFVEVNPLDNDLTWIKERITLAAIRVKLEGSIIFAGSEYTQIKSYKDAGNRYIDIKIEQNSGGWNTVFEGNAFLFASWDENEQSITLSRFNNDNEYDNLLSNYDIKYGYRTFGLTEITVVTPSTNSTTVDAFRVAGTGLTPAQYVAVYDINGFNYSPIPDPRWAFFIFRSTNGDGSHNFETMSFEFNVNSTDFTEIKLLKNNFEYLSLWVKLPPGVGSTQSFTTVVATAAYRFPDMINELLNIANSSLSFTEATAVSYVGQLDSQPPFTQYAFFDYTKYLYAESSDVGNLDAKQSDVTLKSLFDIMEKAFDLHWYLDGTALKFKHTTELTTSGTLDLSDETANLKRLEYIENDIPDIEVFKTNDIKGVAADTGSSSFPFGKMEIYYRTGNTVLTNKRIKEHNIPIDTNITGLMSGNTTINRNDHCLIEVLDDSSIPRTIFGSNPDWNLRLSSLNLYGHLNKWRYGENPSLATRLKFGLISLIETLPRPLTKIPTVSIHQDLLTNYDFDKEIITSAGSGITEKISQRLDSDILELEIHIS